MSKLSRDQRRKQKVRKRAKKEIKLSAKQMMIGTGVGLSIEDRRKKISDVTHQVVIEAEGGSGLGKCMLYAAVGMFACRHVFGGDWHVQAGDIIIRNNPDSDYCFAISASAGGLSPLGGHEFHCWIVCKERREFVDLSARHYRGMVEGFGMSHIDEGGSAQEVKVWRRPDPPACLWVTVNEAWKWPLDWVRLKPHPPTIIEVHNRIKDRAAYYQSLWSRARALLSMN
jgi:hypothetical protein